MKIKVLVENKSCNRSLKQEHGLSLFINYEGKNILFDTGSTGMFIDNAEVMGIKIEDIDFVIISHAHMDHAGGLFKFLERNKTAKVYISNYSKQNYYIKILLFSIDIGIPKEIFNQYEDRFVFVNEFYEINKNIFIVPNSTNRSFPLGQSSKQLLVKKEGKLEKDNFEHEISLVIINNNKLEIFTGCSHNGISNMVEHSRSFFPLLPIRTVIGGFHLMAIPFKKRLGEKKQFVVNLAENMLQHNIEKIYTTHCTGKKAYNILREIMGNTINYLHTGDEVERK